MKIADFKSHLVGGGARPNLYKVTVPFPGYAGGSNETRRLSFLCKAAQIPGSSLGTIIVPFRGRQLKIGGDRTFAEWNLVVLNDTDFLVRKAFEKWSNGINEHINNTGLDIVDYMMDGEVEQLDRKGETIQKYIFRGMWPSEVGPIELSYETNDTIEEFPVIMQYQWWENAESTS